MTLTVNNDNKKEIVVLYYENNHLYILYKLSQYIQYRSEIIQIY